MFEVSVMLLARLWNITCNKFGVAMHRTILVMLLACAMLNTGFSLANAAWDDSIYGAYSVSFEPVYHGGELRDCTLVYVATQADHAYLGGKPVAITGYIGVGQFGTRLMLHMKVGVKDAMGNRPMIRPNFAYLQTKSHSTAKAEQTTVVAEGGTHRMFAYSFYDTSVMKLFEEMLVSGKVTIGFNREKNGMDVLVPMDLDVIEVYSDGDKGVGRKRSKETLLNFKDCTLTLTKQIEHSLMKNE